MQTEAVGSSELAVVAGDVLALRGAGLAAPETWALLCQAAQALQDLFLSNGGVVGGSGVGPVVTPHTLELTPRGRVTLQIASPETARAYLPPEYRPGRVYSDTDSEKMWMYSLGRALLDTTPRIAALTGSVSVSPSSALQSVLSAMTEPDPRRRASLMNLLDVISEYCRTRLQSKPFTHIVMDMYREVMRSPQYAARKRAAFPALRSVPPPTQRPHQRQNQHQAQSQQQNQHLQNQKQHQTQPHQHTGHFSKHQVKGALFKAQSHNSRSHPNLLSLSGHEPSLSSPKPQFQSQIDIKTSNAHHSAIHHTRTSSQPEYSERVQRGLAGQTRSTHNLTMFSNGQSTPQTSHANNVYSDPIYALPVKPFLSSQDVRINGLLAKPGMAREDFYGQTITGRPRTIKNGGFSQPNIAHLARASKGEKSLGQTDDIRGRGSIGRNSQTMTAQLLHRQYSNPQLPTRNLQESVNGLQNYSQNNGSAVPPRLRVFNGDNKMDGNQQNNAQTNLVSSMKVPSLHGPVPPKPPRVMTTLKRSAAPLPEPNNGLSESVAPAKPPRLAIKNGPRARRGKPVQRAPSRLYRAIGGPTRCFNKNQCVGPEFVVRANQPPKILCVGDAKASSSGRIVVILLTGQRIEVSCDPQKITAGELFQAIVQAEGLDENFTLGLAALLAGDFAMLPPETKLNKVAPPGWLNSGKSKGTLGLPTSFMLYLRSRFFLPSLRGTRSWISKHLLYLQIRRCILEQQLVCPLAQLVNLTGFALQAEFGNYNVNEHGRGDYFLLEHYIPESLILNPDLQLQQSQLPGGAEALRARLHQAHRDRRGLDSNNSEEMFITHAQALPDYGSHYYIATADNKELEKIIARLKKSNANRSPSATTDGGLYACTENIYQLDASSDCPVYGKIEFNHVNSCDNVQRTIYTDEQKMRVASTVTNVSEDIYAVPTKTSVVNLVETNNNSNNNNKLNRSKKSESNVWLAIHAQGLKLFERGGQPRDRNELARLQWRDIQTLSYSKNSLVVYTRFNGKRCKFKLRMDHKKSYYAFKLTSLHHQFFLKLRSELTSLHGLAKDFGIPLMVEPVSQPLKLKPDPSKPKITIVNSVKNVPNSKYPMQLEEYQNKENENPQKVINPLQKSDDMDTEPVCYTPEEDALYAQVNARLEPEGASRDTEDESDRALTSRNGHVVEILKPRRTSEEDKLNSYPNHGLPGEKESLYSIPKPTVSNSTDRTKTDVEHPEELYAAINKTGNNKKNSEYPVPDEVWDVANSMKNLHKVKTSSLPNYGTPRQSTGFRTPSLPRRLGVKMGTRAIYSSVVQRDSDLTDDLESLSVKSDTASSIQSASAQSNDSPMPEAYVLNADIRTDDETFRIGNDDTMSASLAARLEELSFAEERILHTIQLERGHGGSIGLQVTEGNDGGVYVQAVSVGGSADMAGNVNKGDRIVAINGQSLLNLRYEEALKMLQSSSETVELVLSQITSNRHVNVRHEQLQIPTESSYLHNLRFEISSEAETSSLTTKWLSQRATDVASVQNTSSAYSSAASSSMVEIGAPPPVPPRRRRRKNDVVVPSRPIIATRKIVKDDETSVRNGGSKPERKPRSLPPPPPVPQNIVPRERKPRSAGNDYLPSATAENTRSSSVKLDSNKVNLQSKPVVQVFANARTSPRFIVTEVKNIEENSISAEHDRQHEFHDERSSVNLDYRNENRSGRSSPMPQHFSPLFFTLRDFESVMANSGKSDRCMSEQFDSIVTPDESVPALITSFIENSVFEDCDEEENDEQVCFRVTTTNVPFEKCLGDWNLDYDSGDFNGKFDRTEDNYIFEDYMDRSKRLNARSAAAAFLFDDDTFEKFDTDEPTSLRSATRVRFVIESPTFSNPDSDLDDTCENHTNFESMIINDEITNGNCQTSVVITEITETCRNLEANDDSRELPISDEFGDVPFSSLIETELKTNEEFESRKNYQAPRLNETASDDELKNFRESVESKTCEISHRPRSTPSPRFMSPKRLEPIPDIDDMLMPELPPTYDPREEGFVGKQWKINTDPVTETLASDRLTNFTTIRRTSSTSEGSRSAREAFVSGKLRLDSRDSRDLNSPISDDFHSVEVVTEKPRFTGQSIFIDSALRDFIDNDEDDMDWKDSSDEENETEKPDGSQDSKPLNLNDRGEIKECAKPTVLIRNTFHGREVSLDKYPRSSEPVDRDKKVSDDEKAAKEEDLKIMESSRSRDASSLSADSKDSTNWVPVSVRRNSFLENMLVNDDTSRCPETKVPCSIIATHPKPPTSPSEPIFLSVRNIVVETIEKSPCSLRDFGKHADIGQEGIVEGKTNETREKRLENETGARIVGPEPKVAKTMGLGSRRESGKSTGEAKSDVLNELLCNFSAIKLKAAKPRKRQLDGDEIDEEASFVMEITDEDEKGKIEALERIKIEDTLGVEAIRGKTRINEASVEMIDSPLKEDDEFPMTKTKTAEETMILDLQRPISLDIDQRVSEKTDDGNNRERHDDKSATVFIECPEDRGVTHRPEKCESTKNLHTHRERELDNRDTMISVDKCAIDRNTNNPQIRRNINDNNAMIPVDVSDDQKSRETDVTATIAPGSVRSFVELYEIRQEKTSKHSKSNYTIPVARTRSATRCFKGLWNNADYDTTDTRQNNDEIMRLETKFASLTRDVDIDVSKVEAQGQIKVGKSNEKQDTRINVENGDFVRDEFLRTNDSTYVHDGQSSAFIPVAAKRRTQESCLKINNELSPRSDSKKTVTFYNDCRVAKLVDNPRSEIISSLDTNIGVTDGRPKTPKRRAPVRPADVIREMKEHDGAKRSIVKCDRELNPSGARLTHQGEKVNPTPSPRSAVSSIPSQTHQAANKEDEKDCTGKSGIASSAPKSDVPQLRQSYVFYCKV